VEEIARQAAKDAVRAEMGSTYQLNTRFREQVREVLIDLVRFDRDVRENIAKEVQKDFDLDIDVVIAHLAVELTTCRSPATAEVLKELVNKIAKRVEQRLTEELHSGESRVQVG